MKSKVVELSFSEITDRAASMSDDLVEACEDPMEFLITSATVAGLAVWFIKDTYPEMWSETEGFILSVIVDIENYLEQTEEETVN